MSEDLMDSSLLAVFLADVGKASRAITEAIKALEADLAKPEPLLSGARAAHSLKGAASAVMSVEELPQLAAIVDFAHAIEDCFGAAKAGKARLTDEDLDALKEAEALIDSLAKSSEAEIFEWIAVNENELSRVAVCCAAIATGKTHAAPHAAQPKEPEQPKTLVASPPPPPLAEKTSEPELPPPKKPEQLEPSELGDMSMLGLFRMEAETNTQILSEGIMKLESGASDKASVEPLMRAAHSLKGAARILQLDGIVKLAHSMESCFVSALEGKAALRQAEFDRLLEGVDLIRKLSETQEAAFKDVLSKEAPRMSELAAAYASAAEGKGLPASASAQDAPEPQPQEPQQERQPGQPQAKAAPDSKESFVRVGAENLDRLLALAGESYVDSKRMRGFQAQMLSLKKEVSELSDLARRLATASARGAAGASGPDEPAYEASQLSEALEKAYSTASELHIDFDNFLLKAENFSDSLYNEVVSCRIRPFEDGVASFPRMVRDLAKKLGKKVKLNISGHSSGVDRDILEKLGAPLNHIIRNAMDHGLESPAERQAAGKPETGALEINAYHWAGMLNIKISDDGRGIDLEKIRAKVVERSLATAAMAQSLTEAELLEFLFLPGFSTAKELTEISGRGVGLDVVQNIVQEVRGSVKIQTTKGSGTCFHLQLPITLSVVSSLLVKIGGEAYAFPLMRVDRLIRASREEIKSIESHQFITCNGENIGLVSAREILGYPTEEDDGKDEILAVVISDRLNQYAVMVDELNDERRLVVRPIDQRLGKIPYISSASVLDDGTTALIVDVDDMARSIDSLLKGGRLHKIRKGRAESKRGQRRRALVVDDSITVRELERNLLSNQGYEVEIAVDGADGWNALRTGSYDIVITDIDMPRMNGYELVERIKSNENLKSIPVIIVSYKDREEDRLKGLEAGAEYFLTKGSFHDNTLINAVRDLIGEAAK